MGSPLSSPSGSAYFSPGWRGWGLEESPPPLKPCSATREWGGKSPKQNFFLQSLLARCWAQEREQIGKGTKLRGLSCHWRLPTVDFILCTIVRLTTVLTLSLLLMRNRRVGSSVLWASWGRSWVLAYHVYKPRWNEAVTEQTMHPKLRDAA